jgi:hypothetical protein
MSEKTLLELASDRKILRFLKKIFQEPLSLDSQRKNMKKFAEQFSSSGDNSIKEFFLKNKQNLS